MIRNTEYQDAKSSIRDTITLEEVFQPGGILEHQLADYEYRPSQLEMAQSVLAAIRNQQHLCVEAGTGTGKTLAYLIPALFGQKRVIVSTATKNLQEQLFFKDIPLVRELLFPELRVTYMKGRQNYLCRKKFYEEYAQVTLLEGTPGEGKEISEWIQRTETGDRSELSWIRDDSPLWKHLDARSDNCLGQKCSYFEDCYITLMRQKALESDLIVVNHALFFANLALQSDEIGRVLPDFSTLILDEAHGVEDIAANYFGKHVSNYQLDEFCRDLLKVCPEFVDTINELRQYSVSFFEALPSIEGRHSLNLFRTPDDAVVDLRSEITEPFRRLIGVLQRLYHRLQRQVRLPSQVDALLRRLEQLLGDLEETFTLDASDQVYWFERRGRGIFLHVTPVDVAPILQEKLFSRTETVIITSATLTTQNNFEHIKERLGVADSMERIVLKEFDYSQQTILYVPAAFPEPHSPQYFERALHEIRQILAITDGHAFLLFTSFHQMDRVYSALQESPLHPLLRQGDMPKNQLLELFKRTPRAVLCATSSFWQGVDVPGDALRAVIVDKLPFLVPTEPLVAARIHRLEEKGENPFLKYSVPDAIITLKQGLGRLIRSRRDRGILAVIDSRLRTRSYGRLFLESLPNYPLTDNMGELKGFFR